MEVKLTYSIVLSESDAIALKKLLGAESMDSKKSKGLTESEAQMISEIYDSLPDENED